MTSVQSSSTTISLTKVNSDEVNNNLNMTNSEDLYNHIELDSQIILRLPNLKQENGTVRAHPAALALKQLLNNRNESELESLKDRLFVEINSETRKGRVKFDNEIFDARLVDLPCIVESLKTKDKKLLVKTADICQMLICKTKDDPWLSDDDGQFKANNHKESQKIDSQTDKFKKFQWPHGLTPPLKNVRRKRFRKVAKKKVVDYEEIEKEVKHLFRADREAIKVDYEVLYVEGDLDDEENNMSKENVNQNEDDYDSSDMDETSKMASFKNSADKLNESSSQFKSKMEESNMSSDIDDDSIMLKSAKSKRVQNLDDTNLNATNFDDYSNDTSNLMSTNSDKKVNRTNFKNLFVKEVIGDLSSSSNESDQERDGEKIKTTKSTKTKVFTNEDSVTNFDDATSAADNNFDEYEEGDGDDEENYKDDNEDESISVAFESKKTNEGKNKNSSNNTKKVNINDMLGFEEDDDLDSDEEDEDDEEEKKSNNNEEDDDQDGDDKEEIRNQLGSLHEDLKRIQEDRKKREIEISSINNPVLKAHLTSRLNILIDEEGKKLAKIDELKALLNE
jgi:transcription initiation factor TFIID subunit 7